MHRKCMGKNLELYIKIESIVNTNNVIELATSPETLLDWVVGPENKK